MGERSRLPVPPRGTVGGLSRGFDLLPVLHTLAAFIHVRDWSRIRMKGNL